MKNLFYLPVALTLLLAASCASAPPEQTNETPNSSQQEVPETHNSAFDNEPEMNFPVRPADDDAIVVQFDTITITNKTYKETKSEIQLVVDDLNKITTTKDYNRWQGYLSEEYRDTFSDPANLEQVSASLPTKGIRLRTLKDYFTYVFVPSRQNMRVDDIQFVSPTRVYVIMEIAPGSPAAIYILEKTSHGWKLVPKKS